MQGARLATVLPAALAVVAIAWWWLGDDATAPPPTPADAPASAGTAEQPSVTPAAPPPAPPPTAAGAAPVFEVAPAHRIAEGGRLSLASADLPRDGALALGLDLPDVARGSEPRPVRIVSQDGTRRLDLLAGALPGPGSGVGVRFDPGWLRPDRYLVEVTTAEDTHFPLRRYVLEVR